jgi:hypothetical protein
VIVIVLPRVGTMSRQASLKRPEKTIIGSRLRAPENVCRNGPLLTNVTR